MNAADGLMARLDVVLASGTPVEKGIAVWLRDHVAELPFETAATLAQKIRVSEVSIGRFARRLGYRNLKDMKEALKADQDADLLEQGAGGSPWLRGPELRARLASGGSRTVGGQALERELQAVMRNHELATSDAFAACVKRLSHARRVRVAGFQTERGLASYLAHNLAYLRPDVQAIEMDGGHFAEVFLDDPQGTALVVIEIRRYSALACAMVARAREAGIPVTVITDSYCGWAQGVADEVLQVETDFGHYWDASGQIAGLINLLVNAAFEELGPGIEDRFTRIAASYHHFVGHLR